MSRPTNPFRVVVKQVLPQMMKSTNIEGKDILIAHVQLSEDQPIPLMSFAFRFESPKEMLNFLQAFIDKAAEIWPNDPMMKYYKEDTNE